jgi:hypothetical protein
MPADNTAYPLVSRDIYPDHLCLLIQPGNLGLLIPQHGHLGYNANATVQPTGPTDSIAQPLVSRRIQTDKVYAMHTRLKGEESASTWNDLLVDLSPTQLALMKERHIVEE